MITFNRRLIHLKIGHFGIEYIFIPEWRGLWVYNHRRTCETGMQTWGRVKL